jgi:hypothetical protein
VRTWQRRRGKILAVKWGMNPNSSSLGADVTFLLFGATALGMLTPLVAALVRYRRKNKGPVDVAPAVPTTP